MQDVPSFTIFFFCKMLINIETTLLVESSNGSPKLIFVRQNDRIIVIDPQTMMLLVYTDAMSIKKKKLVFCRLISLDKQQHQVLVKIFQI